MQNASDLQTQLQAIHRKSYPAYKSLKGSYQFRDFILHIDHVQGDPFASPSHIRIRLSHKTAGFPATYYKDTLTRVTLADYLTRQFSSKLRSAATLSVQKVRAKAVSFPSATADRKCFHVPPAKLRTKKSPRDFLLDSRQTGVPLMPQNWKKSSLIFSRSVLKRHFSIKTPITETWNRQSSLPRIRIRFAHS